ncbi:MAG: TetR/AcrR family transcriptional regulator [Actinomycetes bacterium]
MSVTDNSPYRRTREAILEGTKSLIEIRGLRATTMIDIADNSEVSRATLYNHFRDKESVLRALLESEVDRLCGVLTDQSLEQLSIEISCDRALATLRNVDPEVVTHLLRSESDPLWHQIGQALLGALGNPVRAQLAARWLIGQVFAPLTPSQSHEQALAIVASSQS